MYNNIPSDGFCLDESFVISFCLKKTTEMDGKATPKTIEELYKNHEFYIGLGLAVKQRWKSTVDSENNSTIYILSTPGIV